MADIVVERAAADAGAPKSVAPRSWLPFGWRGGGPIRPVLLIGCLAIIVLGGLTTTIIIELRARELVAARQELVAFDVLLAEQTARAIQGVDLVITEVADELIAGGVTTAADFDRLKGNSQVYRRLHDRIINIPQLDAITLDSADGHLVNFSRYFPIPAVDIADRAYFRTLRDNPTLTTLITEPVRNRGSGVWNIYVAHRINGPHGEFVGLVMGAMRVDYFESLYETISKAGGTSIGLWRQDGMLLARYPRVESAMGERFAAKDRFERLVPDETSVTIDDSDVDGVRRMIASRLLPREAIVVDASQTMREVLADWRREAFVIGLSGIGLMLTAAALVWALVRQFGAYEAMAHAVAAREEAVLGRQVAEERLLLAQKMEAIGRITSGVAHDFNNLLTSIIANAELLQRGSSVEPVGARRVSTILQAADRGAALVRQLLAFSRQQVLAPARVDVGARLAGMTELLESALGGGVGARISVAGRLWPVMVDPVQFENMILNLAINARDALQDARAGHAPAGSSGWRSGSEVVIAAENWPSWRQDRPAELAEGAYVVLSVIDTGSGMSEDVLRNVFEPFFTTKPLGRGSGLGLSQVYGVARQSGGTVRIRSQVGAGTTVEVFLPRAPSEHGMDSGAAGDVIRRRVLLVDDDPLILETVAAALGEAGLLVETATDGAAALRRMAEGPVPDVLVLDCRMPGLAGREVAARARARLPGLPVVFMTGDADGELKENETWIIEKPFLASTILQMLRRVFDAATTTKAGD